MMLKDKREKVLLQRRSCGGTQFLSGDCFNCAKHPTDIFKGLRLYRIVMICYDSCGVDSERHSFASLFDLFIFFFLSSSTI